jgi:hypothetical protein
MNNYQYDVSNTLKERIILSTVHPWTGMDIKGNPPPPGREGYGPLLLRGKSLKRGVEYLGETVKEK